MLRGGRVPAASAAMLVGKLPFLTWVLDQTGAFAQELFYAPASQGVALKVHHHSSLYSVFYPLVPYRGLEHILLYDLHEIEASLVCRRVLARATE